MTPLTRRITCQALATTLSEPLLLLVLVLVLTDVTFAKKLFHEAIVADGKVYVDCVVPEPW